MQLTSQQKKAKALEELEWFFWHCDPELGIKSNYHLFIKAIMFSTNESDEHFNEDSIVALLDSHRKGNYWKASARNLQIFRIYQQLSSKSKEVLENYYTQKRLPMPITLEFGQLAFILPMTKSFKTYSMKFADIQNTNNKKKLQVFKRMKTQAETIFNTALNEYISLSEKESN